MAKSTGLAKQIADLDRTPAYDFDPEEDAPEKAVGSSESEDSEDDLAGTEHYAQVSKSKLRKADEVALGPEYSGSKVSRRTLAESEDDYGEEGSTDEDAEAFADPEDVDLDVAEEDGEIDSDEALGESDEEKFKEFTFRGSAKPRMSNGRHTRPTAVDFMSDSDDAEQKSGLTPDTDDSEVGEDIDIMESEEELLDIEEQHPDVSEDDEVEENGAREEEMDLDGDPSQASEYSEEESEDESEDEDAEKARRAELKRIMGEEQKTVVATISQAAKADAAKGDAVKQQRKTFDSLLSVRMDLQKALIATNSMAAIDERDLDHSPTKVYEAAEEAAIKLWNTLDGIRHELSKTSGAKTGQKRKRAVEAMTSSASLWERMQNTEIISIDHRQQTLEKWSSKVRGATALPLSRKLNPAAPQQSITSMIQDQLASSDHLIKKTKMPRSCAPVQRDLKLVEDPDIYDDGNFYQMLLKELVDQRRTESISAPIAGEKPMQWVAVKEAKTRKHVDTKASKGRKMRFTVHEKLQNFMAPEARGSWEPEAIDRFFGTLLGQKMNLGAIGVSDDEDSPGNEDEGLMLFRS